VIIEVSIAKRFDEGYEFEDIISFMKESGFFLFSFLKLTHRMGELRPRFADIVFKQRCVITKQEYVADDQRLRYAPSSDGG